MKKLLLAVALLIGVTSFIKKSNNGQRYRSSFTNGAEME